jgi:hypothetical protein
MILTWDFEIDDDMNNDPKSSEDPLRELAARLARGDISLSEYKKIKDELESDLGLGSGGDIDVAWGLIFICGYLIFIWPINVALNWSELSTADQYFLFVLVLGSIVGGVLMALQDKRGLVTAQVILFIMWLVGCGVVIPPEDLENPFDKPRLKMAAGHAIPFFSYFYLAMSERIKKLYGP